MADLTGQSYNSKVYGGVRAVVSLPFNTQVEKREGIWTVLETGKEPEQPTSGKLSDLVTNANIGDYIDLGKNVVKTSATTDDWRILYIEGSTVYAILADYLPNSTGYAASAGLNTSGTNVVYSSTSASSLLTGLKSGTSWKGLANGISGATVTGAPTWELIAKSYNAKNSASLPTTNTGEPTFNKSTKDYDLYVLNSDTYWLADIVTGNSNYLYTVSGGANAKGASMYNATYCNIRPVVALPSSTNVKLVNGVWTVSN